MLHLFLVVARFLLWTLVGGTAPLPLPVLSSVPIPITVLALVLLRSSVFTFLGRFMMPVPFPISATATATTTLSSPVVAIILPVPVIFSSLSLQVRPVFTRTFITVKAFITVPFFTGVRVVTKVLIRVVIVTIVTSLFTSTRSSKCFIFIRVIIVILLLITRLWIKKVPSSTLKETIRIINNRFHDLAPIEGLETFCVLDVTAVEPLLHVIQHRHGNCRHHRDLLPIVLEDEDHIKVLHAEADSLKVTELHVLQGDHKWRPLYQVDQTT